MSASNHTPVEEAQHIRYHLTAAQLLEEGSAERLALRVQGTSMVPTLRPGDTVFVERVAAHELCVGDLVVWQDGHRYVVHRLVACSPAGPLYTKGDNVTVLDPPVSTQALLGRVVLVERGKQRVELRTGWATLAAKLMAWWGRLEARLAPATGWRPLCPLRRAYRLARNWLWRLLSRLVAL